MNSAKPKVVEVALTPIDNARLANLCGAIDENLRQIETAFDVTISRRGEHCFSAVHHICKGRCFGDYDRAPGQYG